MSQILFVVQAYFVRSEGFLGPWSIQMTSTRCPYQMTTIGLRKDYEVFNHEELEYNLKNGVPRLFEKLDFKSNNLISVRRYMQRIFDDERPSDGEYCMAAFDQPTFNFLKTIGAYGWENMLLLLPPLPIENRESVRDAAYIIHVSFFRQLGRYFPWSLTLTSTTDENRRIKFGISRDGLLFTPRDVEYNLSHLEDFRDFSRKLNHEITFQAGFHSNFFRTFNEKYLCPDSKYQFATADLATRNYLTRVYLEDVLFLESPDTITEFKIINAVKEIARTEMIVQPEMLAQPEPEMLSQPKTEEEIIAQPEMESERIAHPEPEMLSHPEMEEKLSPNQKRNPK